MGSSFLGSGPAVRERTAVARFEPNGFASVVYDLIVAARWFDDERDAPAWHGVARRLRDRVHKDPSP